MGKIDIHTPARELVDVYSFEPRYEIPEMPGWELVHLKEDPEGSIPVIRYYGKEFKPFHGAIVYPAGVQAIKPKTHIATWNNLSPVAFTKDGHKLDYDPDPTQGWGKWFNDFKEHLYPHERLAKLQKVKTAKAESPVKRTPKVIIEEDEDEREPEVDDQEFEEEQGEAPVRGKKRKTGSYRYPITLPLLIEEIDKINQEITRDVERLQANGERLAIAGIPFVLKDVNGTGVLSVHARNSKGQLRELPLECYATGAKLSGKTHSFTYGEKMLPVISFKVRNRPAPYTDHVPTHVTYMMKCAANGMDPAITQRAEILKSMGPTQAYIQLVRRYDHSKTLEQLFPKRLRNTIIYTQEEYDRYLEEVDGDTNKPVRIASTRIKKKSVLPKRKKAIPHPQIERPVATETSEEQMYPEDENLQTQSSPYLDEVEPENGQSLEEQLFADFSETHIQEAEKPMPQIYQELLSIFRLYDKDTQIELIRAAGDMFHNNQELQKL